MKRSHPRIVLTLLAALLFPFGMGLGSAASPTAPPQARESAEPAVAPLVVAIVIDGGINPATSDFISESIRAAHRDGAAALLIQLDTPGGLLESAKDIVKDLLGAPLPVIVYVAPGGAGATSAGVFVTMAASLAVMAPGTNIGAAHPVSGGGKDIEGDMREKVQNFTVSLSKSIAQERGRNVEWAEKAVRESVSITEQEALQLGVIDLVAESREDLFRQADGREVAVGNGRVKLTLAGARVETRDMTLKQRVLNVLANPNVAYLLMMAGLLGLYVEFTNPGLLFPGVAGAICLLLGMAALQVLPINISGLGLIVLGIALLVAEVFVPSFGTLGIGGIAAFVLGSLLLFDESRSDLVLQRSLVYTAAAVIGLVALVLGTLVVRSQTQRASLGQEGLIGERGRARSPLRPDTDGRVLVHGELWNARSENEIPEGAEIEVVRVEGLQLLVRAAPPRSNT